MRMLNNDTQKILQVTPMLGFLLILVACATSEGSSVQPESSLKIIVGQTTQEEVFSVLGAPKFKRIIVSKEGSTQKAWVYDISQIESDLLPPEMGKSIMTGGLDRLIEIENSGVSIRFTQEGRVATLTEVHWSDNGLGLLFTP